MQFKNYLLEEMTPRTQQEDQAAGISDGIKTKTLETFTGKKKDTSDILSYKKLVRKIRNRKIQHKNFKFIPMVEYF